jgi:anti-sigma regulatory factor (Ser/Thr protein kinase)
MATMNDEITLTLPAERDFYRVAHLVLGGLAVRLNLTFEHLEDLQIALDELLDNRTRDGEVTVSVCVQDDAIEARVGPFPDGRVRAELEHDEGAVGLRRVLDAVVDRVALRADDDGDWVTLTKTVEPPEGAA